MSLFVYAANYSAAKGAVVSLAQTLALEGHRYGILCNAIATGGLTRMTEGMGSHDDLPPEHTAFGVVRLCHELSTDTAGFFRVEGGHIFKLRWQASQGRTFALPAPRHDESDGEPMVRSTARVLQEIDDEWETVVDFEQHSYPQAERQAKILSSPRL